MPLDERKKKILEAIINEYILTVEPIGSRTIAKKYDLGISPATIRNEMADLEEMGYIEQPYTSAGRIPSDKGYRYYVNNIIENYLSETYLKDIELFDQMLVEIDDIVKKFAKFLSDRTKHTIVVKMPKIDENKIKRVQIIPVDSKKIVLLIITESGIIKNYLINLSMEIDCNNMEFLNNLLNDKLAGKNERDMDNNLKNEIKSWSRNAEFLIDEITNGIIKSLGQIEDIELYIEGSSNILNFPEYRDMIKAKNFFELLGNRDIMNTVLEPEQDILDVTIGSENKFDNMKDLSIIKATYLINEEIAGSLGIIGPTRMNYFKLLNEINVIAKELSYVLSNIYRNTER
ncbi:heat-inducible transcription repressor HrcA [Aceticella autotrophica]|uniref:Heat-inducible transcription repressor HrcA n=1 Tax=Aceticella autotrophica TaxID=2755338 RepID=A0A975GB81_9THEO|nr:heat-inducible transcriptional repressor HrcA [Aceticella autotrophica]QSZ28163.1 heat-inducible transcription repressor HrcA [Aceticella autotrophica]